MSGTNELSLLKSARREMWIALGIWLCATVWSVGYCSLYGYDRDPVSLKYVLGFPDWVFWGLVLPWGLCTVVSSIFALFVMTDENLDAANPETNTSSPT